MSTIFALAANNCAIVASDGRIMDNHNICGEDFDKTFEIVNGDKKFIGTYAGAMLPGGQSIREYLQEILNRSAATTIEEGIDFLRTELLNQLRGVPIEQFRVVDILLVGSYVGLLSDFKIYITRYGPNEHTNIVEVKQQDSIGGNTPVGCICWSIFGDDNAREAIHTVLNGCSLRVPKDEASLRYFCEPLIKIGILNATINHLGHAVCGGNVFVRSIV